MQDEDSSRSCGDTQIVKTDIYVRPQAKLPDYWSSQPNRIAVCFYIHGAARYYGVGGGDERRDEDPYFVLEKETLTQYRIFYRDPTSPHFPAFRNSLYSQHYKRTSGLYTVEFIIHGNISKFDIMLDSELLDI